jgi:hypothetical protein
MQKYQRFAMLSDVRSTFVWQSGRPTSIAQQSGVADPWAHGSFQLRSFSGIPDPVAERICVAASELGHDRGQRLEIALAVNQHIEFGRP